MKRLIINSDDYGRSPDISRGIREAHLHGVVTSTTCMMNIPTTAGDIASALEEAPKLGLGVHLVLTMGKPISAPESVPSLIDENGYFFKNKKLLERLPSLDVDEVKMEWRAQIERFVQAAGRKPDHLDSHHHSSYYTPELFRAMLELAQEYDCPIRYPFTEVWWVLEETSKQAPALMQEFNPRLPDALIGDFYDEEATWEHLLEIINRLEDGTNELMCHPGYVDQEFAEKESPYNFQRERELKILTDPTIKDAILSNGIELISFADLHFSNDTTTYSHTPEPPMSRIDDLLTQMTLEEKISMLAGADLWHTVAVPRLGIPQFKTTDGPNGARGAWASLASSSVATPVGIALGATWNPALVEKVGNVLAEELEAKGAHILLAPTVNIHRTPIAGRNFECFSEDPFLSGMIASAYIKGIQDKGKGACIKHFVANDQEYERFSISSEVDERTLREIYLEPFRIAIRNANPWSVMSSYNRVNGTYACENDHTLKDILKGEWGYDGVVISDWHGTYDTEVPAGGLDLEMPGPARWMAEEHVKRALEKGTLTEEAVNDKVRRLLGVLEKAGLFENPSLHNEKGENKAQHRKVMREAAREAIVLLKNDGTLPLKKVKSIAVIGPYANAAQILGGGSSSVTPHYVVTPYEGIKNRAGKIKVETVPGCRIYKSLPAPAPETLSTADGRQGLTLKVFNGTEFSGEPVFSAVTPKVQHGWFDRSVPNADQECFSVIMEGFFTPQESGVQKLELSSVGWSKLYLDDNLLIDHSHDSDMGKALTKEIKLTGGKSYPIKVEFFWKGNPRWKAVNIGHQPPQPKDGIAEAVKLAKNSDVVVLVAGLNNEWETEGADRVDMKLPGKQNELIERVLKANKNTIVVLNVGSAVEMPWIDKAPAVVQMWYDGQEQGNALADILFGDETPSGKLPTTFPVRLEDNPAYINYPGENGKVRYGEGIFVGYRYYDKKNLAPLFPFGHGLSYTTFKYSNLRIGPRSITPAQTLKVRVDVTNTGKVTGKEIVQLYVRDVKSTFARPEKELKGFQKVELKPGQTKTVTFTLDREAFWYFDGVQNAWSMEPGEFEILVGASSRDIRLNGTVTLLPEPRASRFHTGLTIRTLLDHPGSRAIVTKYAGGFLLMEDMSMAVDMTLEQVAANHPNYVSQELLAKIQNDLAEIQ